MLEVKDLSTSFFTDDGEVKAVRNVSFDLEPGETLGIVGESGCGKSVTAMSILGLVQRPGRIIGGQIMFKGDDLVKLKQEELRQIRGRDIAMIFQDPLSSMNPVLRVGFQIEEAMRAHNKIPHDDVPGRTVDLLTQVRVPDAARRVHDYPHQFSGGMRQRAMIAMGLSNKPELLIADEPTTALDVTVQAQILELLRDLNEQMGTSIILITHNLGVVAGLCKRVVVMYAGEVVEEGPVEQIFEVPQHPYTWSLLRSLPRIDFGPARATAFHRGAATRPDRAAAGLRVQPALSVPHRQVLRGGPRARDGGTGAARGLLGHHEARLCRDGCRGDHRHQAGRRQRGASTQGPAGGRGRRTHRRGNARAGAVTRAAGAARR